jgi:phage shock protein A
MDDLNKLLSGEAESEDPTVNYLLQKMKAAAAEGVQASRQLAQMEQGAAQLRERLTALQGIVAEYRSGIEELVQAQAPDPDGGDSKKPDLAPAPEEAA